MNPEEKNVKLDITSTAVEKGIDLAKDFLNSLIMPAVEETGLLIKDKVTQFRFNNQIRTLNKAKAICEKNGINPKTISLKLLVPLLDYSGLEEDEYLQDKWANLLSNMVDSEQNIDNHVFPYLLSQISITELKYLEQAILKKTEAIERLTADLKAHQKEKALKISKLEHQKKVKKEVMSVLGAKNRNGNTYTDTMDIQREIWDIDRSLLTLNYHDKEETNLKSAIYREQYLSTNDIKEYEIANLVRLGIIKAIQIPYASAKTIEIPNDPEATYLKAEVEIEIEADYEDYSFTELGNLFIYACNEKQKVKN